jgi:hypothetical protein
MDTDLGINLKKAATSIVEPKRTKIKEPEIGVGRKKRK